MTLDDRIFILQKTIGLTPDLRRQLMLADIAHLNDRDSDAKTIVMEIEKACTDQGIEIFSLTNYPLYGRMV